ncbi:uncharacterized protein PG998_007559 [Apiospora kogelbergensis]|uniref:Rhodopsin domain-containing protein n=1 Tax=Apiospora kogelbergensis TaxID=1337665 RepID=A0AAW0QCZ2_9PEZI
MGVTFSLATCAIGLRIPARKITKVDLWWDDYCCMGAYFFAAAWGALILLWISNGLGRHLDDVEDPKEVAFRTANLLTFFLQLAYTYSITLIKFAILAFYWRVFNTSSIRRPIIILAILSGAWLLARTLLTIFHCVPVQAFWDVDIEDATCPISDPKYLFWSTLAHFILDFVIIVLPIVEIRKLQQFSRLQKIGTSALFAFGILVCAASLVVVVLAKDFNASSKDMTWNMADIMLWATVEVNLSVVSACLPLFRPVFVTVKKNSLHISKAESGAYRLPSASSSSSKYDSGGTAAPSAAPSEAPLSNFDRDSRGWMRDRVTTGGHHESSIPNFSAKPRSIRGFASIMLAAYAEQPANE